MKCHKIKNFNIIFNKNVKRNDILYHECGFNSIKAA